MGMIYQGVDMCQSSGPYKQALYDNLKSLRKEHPKINIAFADFFPLWNAINR